MCILQNGSSLKNMKGCWSCFTFYIRKIKMYISLSLSLMCSKSSWLNLYCVNNIVHNTHGHYYTMGAWENSVLKVQNLIFFRICCKKIKVTNIILFKIKNFWKQKYIGKICYKSITFKTILHQMPTYTSYIYVLQLQYIVTSTTP